MNSMYTDGTYLAANPGWHAQDAHWKLMHVLRALKAAKVQARLSRVCDVGCGSGDLIKEWARRCPQITFTGCDISPQAHAMCLQNAPANTRFVQGAKIENDYFDAVLAIDVLEHVPNPEDFLNHLEQKADLLVLHVPLDLSVRSVIKPEILETERRTVGHIHFYTAPYLRRMLRARGYQILSWHYTNKYVECPPPLERLRSRVGMMIRRAAHFCMPRAWAAWIVGGYSIMLVARCRKN